MGAKRSSTICDIMPGYNNPNHPEHITWKAQRRKRFVEIIREAKRVCKFSEEERELVIKLADLVTKNTKEMLRQK